MLPALLLLACAHKPRQPLAPVAPPEALVALVGEYGPDSAPRFVREEAGHLELLANAKATPLPLTALSDGVYSTPDRTRVVFSRNARGRVTSVVIGFDRLTRLQLGPTSGNQLVITPVRPLAELRREALAASPPNETGTFRKSDLVELTSLDPSIKLEIRYATSNNLFGTPFYTQARAFLQRPAAEAVVRAHRALKAKGYGLLIHDGYRPWSVTKMFWDASPEDKHIFVADPAKGSRHNRGAAVDLTLYDMKTGAAVEMPSTYDETSLRAFPDYPGGTSRQRWHRALLRSAMEAEGFTVYESEWWHFDYNIWREFPIGNITFEAMR